MKKGWHRAKKYINKSSRDNNRLDASLFLENKVWVASSLLLFLLLLFVYFLALCHPFNFLFSYILYLCSFFLWQHLAVAFLRTISWLSICVCKKQQNVRTPRSISVDCVWHTCIQQHTCQQSLTITRVAREGALAGAWCQRCLCHSESRMVRHCVLLVNCLVILCCSIQNFNIAQVLKRLFFFIVLLWLLSSSAPLHKDAVGH